MSPAPALENMNFFGDMATPFTQKIHVCHAVSVIISSSGFELVTKFRTDFEIKGGKTYFPVIKRGPLAIPNGGEIPITYVEEIALPVSVKIGHIIGAF